jgi:hypothetical protein
MRVVESSLPSTCTLPLRAYNICMAKKTTLNELGEMLDHVVKHMATKDDLEKIENKVDGLVTKVVGLETKVDGLKVKVDGIQNTLDREAVERADQKLPDRVARIEKHLDSQSTGWRS